MRARYCPSRERAVATSASPDGVKALHSYAAAAQKQADMMAEAHKGMQSGTMKSKM